MVQRTVRHALVRYTDADGIPRTAHRGETIDVPEGVALASMDRAGAFGEAVEPGPERRFREKLEPDLATHGQPVTAPVSTGDALARARLAVLETLAGQPNEDITDVDENPDGPDDQVTDANPFEALGGAEDPLRDLKNTRPQQIEPKAKWIEFAVKIEGAKGNVAFTADEANAMTKAQLVQAYGKVGDDQ